MGVLKYLDTLEAQLISHDRQTFRLFFFFLISKCDLVLLTNFAKAKFQRALILLE